MFVSDKAIRPNNSIAIKSYMANSAPQNEQPFLKKNMKIVEIPENIISKLELIDSQQKKIKNDFNDFSELRNVMNNNLDKILSEVRSIEKKISNAKGSGDYENLSKELNKAIKKNIDNINEYSSVSINDMNLFDGNLNVIYQTLNSTVLFSITDKISIDEITSNSEKEVFENMYKKIESIKTNLSEINTKMNATNNEKDFKQDYLKNIEKLKEDENISNFVDIFV